MNVYNAAMEAQDLQILSNAWVRLVRGQHHVLTHVEAALKQAGFPPLLWYDVLLELAREPQKGLRPVEIEARMLLPQYGVSRLLDRMENAGFVQHRRCEEDGRGKRIYITENGLQLKTLIWPVYRSTLDKELGQKLTRDELMTLGTILEKLDI